MVNNMNLNDDITTIKGIGDKTAAAFKRIKVATVNDLIHTFPRNYLTYDETVDIANSRPGERTAVMAVISYGHLKNHMVQFPLFKKCTAQGRYICFCRYNKNKK